MSFDSLDKHFCIQKVDSAISMVERLIDSDYPHRDSQKALKRILAVYEKDRDLLHSIDASIAQDTVLEHCRRVNFNLVRFKAFLGLLLRSSNIRNAFELYFPIKILSLELLEQPTAVVLSSEWSFSPYTYPVALAELPEFIFIGIPASESQNPLILPLAGHELGHVVWRRKGAKKEFDAIIRAEIIRLYKKNWEQARRRFDQFPERPDQLETDLFLLRIWGESYKLAQRQLEEVFCDCVGLYVFGQSFLHSFRYLVAPSLGYNRAPNYPSLQARARYMMEYGKTLGLKEIPAYANSFSEQKTTLAPGEAFILEMADETTNNLYGRLPEMVEKYRGRAESFREGTNDEPRVKRSLLNCVPAASVASMTAVVNAAWDIRIEIDDWDILRDVEDTAKRQKERLRGAA